MKLARHGADTFGYKASLRIDRKLAQLLRLRVSQINNWRRGRSARRTGSDRRRSRHPRRHRRGAIRPGVLELDLPSGEARKRLARARFKVRAALDRYFPS